jgi:hypothetical protein
MENKVDLVMNVYEATYRNALKPGHLRAIVTDNAFKFNKVVVLINNVHDRGDATLYAQRLQKSGELDAFYFVQDLLDDALLKAGLNRKDLGPIAYYSDWAIVALFLPKSAHWICHWDAEVRMKDPVDWISPSINLMERNGRIATANPNWGKIGLDKETIITDGDFSLGYGFSDQVYLLRTAEFARPVYRYFAPASLRYPLSYVSAIFEQRVDSYMRSNRRLRATYRLATYVHPDNEGKSYPVRTWKNSIMRVLNKAVLLGIEYMPTDDPKWKVNPRSLHV